MKRRTFLFLSALGALPKSIKALASSSQRSRESKVASSWSDLRIWYRQPAREWNEALPIGNGRLGGMVFGDIQTERIQLNEDTVWAGEKRDRNNPEGLRNLAEVRRLLFAGKPKEAEALAERTMIATPKRMPPYQPLGDLILRFPHNNAVDYTRELDLDTGVVKVTYQSGDARFTREIFSSAPDRIIVIRLTSDQLNRISFSATLTREKDSSTRASMNRVMMTGEAIARGDRHKDERKVGAKFHSILQVFPEDGHSRFEGTEVFVEGARAATLDQKITSITANGIRAPYKLIENGVVEMHLQARKAYRISF